jgi:hypothetical protein
MGCCSGDEGANLYKVLGVDIKVRAGAAVAERELYRVCRLGAMLSPSPLSCLQATQDRIRQRYLTLARVGGGSLRPLSLGGAVRLTAAHHASLCALPQLWHPDRHQGSEVAKRKFQVSGHEVDVARVVGPPPPLVPRPPTRLTSPCPRRKSWPRMRCCRAPPSGSSTTWACWRCSTWRSEC